jgi:hypothetical protein
LPNKLNLRRGQGVGLVDEVAEGAFQVQGFSGKGAGGGDGAGVLVPQRVQTGGRLVSIVTLARLLDPFPCDRANLRSDPFSFLRSLCWSGAEESGMCSKT